MVNETLPCCAWKVLPKLVFQPLTPLLHFAPEANAETKNGGEPSVIYSELGEVDFRTEPSER